MNAGETAGAYHAHLDALGELQVELTMSDPRVFFVQLQELALLKEQNRVEMILLDLPELLLEWSELLPSLLGDVERARVVSRFPRPDLVLVHNIDEEAKRIFGALLLFLLLLRALLGGGEEAAATLGARLLVQGWACWGLLGLSLRLLFIVVTIEFG